MLNYKNICSTLIFALLISVLPLKANSSDYWNQHIIRHVDMYDGLPCNFIDDMAQDADGRVWFAMNGGGLTTYDGYNFTTFNQSNSPNLLSNFAHSIAVDSQGHIWLGSDGGLNVFDTESMTMLEVRTADLADSLLVRGPIYHVSVDAEDNVWVAIRHGLLCVKLSDDGAIVVRDYINLKEGTVSAIGVGLRHVYVAIEGTVFTADFNNKKKKIVLKEDGALFGSVIESIAETSGFLWVGTNIGLHRINFTTKEDHEYRYSASDPNSLSQDRVTDICVDNEGNIVIATLRGINIYDRENDNFKRITQDDASPRKIICSNFVNCLLPTTQGLWLGTDVAGADLLSPINLYIKNFPTDEIRGIKSSNSQSPLSTTCPVNAIAEDANGTLWVGIVEGGLSKLPRGANKFSTYTVANHRLVHNSVSSLEIDSDGRLWTGTWGGGISVLDITKPGDPIVSVKGLDQLDALFIGAMKYDSINHGMWVGSIRGIQFIDENGAHHPVPTVAMADINGALGIDIDNDGHLWIGTSIGLFIIDLNTMSDDRSSISFRVMHHKLDDPNVHGDPRITYVYHSDKKKATYICTNGFGLFVCRDGQQDSPKFRVYNSDNGLINNMAVSVAEDENGNLWLATVNGLNLITEKDESIISFSTSDGMLSDSYYWNAALSSPRTGRVLFGSLSGLTDLGLLQSVVSSGNLKAPILTRLELNNKTVLPSDGTTLSRSIAMTDAITIDEADKTLALEFSALHYSSPLSVRYQYKLQGFDDEWVELPLGSHSAQYTNLKAGDYRLRVRYCVSGDQWSAERVLRIIVTPPFYKTVWFAILMAVVVGLIIYAIFRLRLRSVEASKKLLQEEVAQRTQQLSEQKQMLEEKKSELEIQKLMLEEKKNELEQKNDRLLEQNDYITRQKESILSMTARIQKLSIDKLQFFTNISHELRSPLTLITGPVKRALSLTTQPEVRTQLELIDRSAQSLLGTVNQLMDFRKVETGNMELHPVSTEIEKYMQTILSPYVAYAAEQGIELRQFYHIIVPYVKIDIEALSKIMANLLSNAIKYSADGKQIDVYVCQLLRDGQPNTYICVRDHGKGIPESDLANIFDRFYQSHASGGRLESINSSGIGLYVVSHIVMQCNGEIVARNNPTGGLSMRVMLPLHEGQKVEKEDVDDDDDVETIDDKTSTEISERMTILVVEDSADMRTYIRSILEDSYKIVEAENGVDGLTAIAENDIDFIIADLMMPVMDGLEFARKVKSDFAYSHIPILILTAQMNGRYQTESYRVGVESYLHKPFDEEMLKARVSGILSNRQSNQKKFLTTLDTSDLDIQQESEDERFVNRVTDLVKERYKDPEFSIEDIVTEVGCSKSMLHKKMQSVMGQAPGSFIRTYRLNIAREILSTKNNGLNVSQVAYEVGFNDPKYFSRCFAKAFGYPPSTLG